jgi:arginine utilization protein RocB
VQVASKTFKEQDAKLAEFIAKRITFTPESPDSPVAGQGAVKVAKLTDDAFTEENFFFSAAEQEEIRATGFALVAPELHTVTSSEDISSKIASVNSDLTTARRNSSAVRMVFVACVCRLCLTTRFVCL